MHGQRSGSNAPRLAMTLAHIGGVGVGAYFLARDGVSFRDGVLLVCSLTYLLRYLATTFYLLHRAVGWSEAIQVAPFLFAVQAVLGYLGGNSTIPWRWIDGVALGMYVLGSFLNTGSELQRKRWKLNPEHSGHLYSGGLFSLSMHINYFGDALLFTGFALITSSVWALLVPFVMTALFVFVHIPTLDGYLAERYPGEFTAWASHTKRFIPFVY